MGTIIWYCASNPPEGWLECNGQSTAAYPSLAAVVGGQVPDLRGRFIRGWSHGSNLDLGRIFGSYQQATAITYSADKTNDSSLAGGGYTNDLIYGDGVLYSVSTGHGGPVTISPGYMQAVRPYNMALLPCIKY